jgi:long-chain acyl-CoA synthetase
MPPTPGDTRRTVRHLVDLYRSGLRDRPRPDAFLRKVNGAYQPVSSEQAIERIERLAAALIEAGVRPGDRVAILAETRFEWAVADLAVLTAAAATVPIYPTLPPGQIEPLLLDSGAVAIFCSTPAQFEKVRAVWPHVTALRLLVLFDGEVPAAGVPGRVVRLAELELAGARRLERAREALDERIASLTSEHLASIIYTSGTTGVPKGVMLTHGNFVANVEGALRSFDLRPADITLSHLPLSHVFERMAGHFTPIAAGTAIAYASSFDTLPDDLLAHRPTVLMSVPRFYEKVFERARTIAGERGPRAAQVFERAYEAALRWSRARQGAPGAPPMNWQLALAHRIFDLLVYRKLRERFGGRIRFCISGGAPLPADLARFFHACGIPILEGYGMTETSPVIAVNTLERWRIGTVGPPIQNIEVRIADDSEIVTRGPCVMRGYFRRDADTAAVIDRDGWMHTGDLGRLDDGFLAITGRKKDLLVTAGGKKVAPSAIEARLRQCASIAEVMLVGDDRPYLTALIVPNFAALESAARARGIPFANRAELVASEGAHALVEDEIRACMEGLANFEQVRRFLLLDREWTLDAGEITPTLKVRRPIVLQRNAEAIEAMYARSRD